MTVAFDLDGWNDLLPLDDPGFDGVWVRSRLERDWFPFDLDGVTGQVVFTSTPLFVGGERVAGYAWQNSLGRWPAFVSQMGGAPAIRNEGYAHFASHELGHQAGLTHDSRSAPMAYEAPGTGVQWHSEDVLTAQALGVPVQPWVQEALNRWPARTIVFTEIT